ncbi:unnamed protein product [Euphydryas editha]|uniref:Uncharacterized protein n=1 Tax=Euphydryas editha TaxID=104508 RepID=A0AAU9TSC3_EUPED|nr:unnamed protein product [Euphydryas editha]
MRLNVVQRGFAQKLCRAYRTTFLNLLLLLAGIITLDLCVRKATALCGARRGVPQREIVDREVERLSLAMRSPHPAQHINLEFECLVDQEQLTANNGHDFNIYTDRDRAD